MYRLIIVDDEFEIRNGLSRYFPWDSVGFEVAAVLENASSALDYLLSTPVDVVLTDIEMPMMSGLDLAREVQQRRLPVKVIFLSAYRNFEYAREALQYRVLHYITKPTVHSEIFDLFCSVRDELDSERGMQEPQETEDASYYGKIIAEIKHVMEQDIKNITLVAVADHLGRSPSFISRVFMVKMGMTFTDYLTGLRMERANELLGSIEYKVYEVSEMVGYTNSKNFTRAYKKHFGHTPREFRTIKSK